jgi:DNA repair exonuclease SbcCD ATPase subunit
MKIKRLIANAFGTLDREYTFDTSSANLVVEDNEVGKSTLTAAIVAALYGLLKRPASRGDLSEWKRFQPIGGGSYQVEMEVALPDKELIILRDFNYGVTTVRDKLTNKNITPEYLELGRDIVGERLLGLNREQFLKTALVKQLELHSVDKAQELTTKIQAIVDSSSGDMTANQAVEILDETVQKYQGKAVKSGMVQSEIKGLQSEISSIEGRIRELEREREQADEELKKLECLGRKQKAREERREVVEYLRKRKLLEDTEELEALSGYANFPASEYETLVRLSGEINQIHTDEEVTILVANLKSEREKIERIQGQIEKEEEEIKADGFDPEEENRLRSKFELVSEKDKDFIARYDKTKLGLENEVLRVETRLSSVENQIAMIGKTRRDKRFRGIASAAVGLVLTIAGSILLPTVSVAVGIPLIVVGLIVATTGLWVVSSSRRISSGEYDRLTEEKSTLGEECSNHTQQLKDITSSLESLATERQFQPPERIVTDFVLLGQLAGRMSKLRRLEDNLNSANEKLSSFNAQAYEVIMQRQERLKKLKEEIDSLEGQAPELANLAADKSLSEYSEELRAISEKLTRIERERQTLRHALNTIEKYQAEYPNLEGKLEDYRIELEKVRGFQRSVSLARDVLRQISKETHLYWAEILNEKTNAIISKVNPDYEELRFSEDLTYTIKSKDNGLIWQHGQIVSMLSAGAKDQIYLAIRLALSDYFSQFGAPLPIILDDPFITSDDNKFEAGMKFILEQVSPRHQVIVLTCHRQRHQWLIDKNPHWRSFISEVRLT